MPRGYHVWTDAVVTWDDSQGADPSNDVRVPLDYARVQEAQQAISLQNEWNRFVNQAWVRYRPNPLTWCQWEGPSQPEPVLDAWAAGRAAIKAEYRRLLDDNLIADLSRGVFLLWTLGKFWPDIKGSVTSSLRGMNWHSATARVVYNISPLLFQYEEFPDIQEPVVAAIATFPHVLLLDAGVGGQAAQNAGVMITTYVLAARTYNIQTGLEAPA